MSNELYRVYLPSSMVGPHLVVYYCEHTWTAALARASDSGGKIYTKVGNRWLEFSGHDF